MTSHYDVLQRRVISLSDTDHICWSDMAEGCPRHWRSWKWENVHER